jgi:hypothetical protein
MEAAMRRRGLRLAFKKEESNLPKLVKIVKKAIKQNCEGLHRCIVYGDWEIDISEDVRKAEYSHLIMLTDISLGSIKLIRIELGDLTDSRVELMRKMMRMTGYGIVLCLESERNKKLIRTYRRLRKEGEKVIADGILFCLLKDFLECSILETTFKSTDGGIMQFLP